MNKITNLNDLMIEQLISMYQGEKHLDKTIPEIVEQVYDKKLKEVIENYHEEKEDQLLRINQVFYLLYTPKRGEPCEAIDVMLIEAFGLVKRSADPEVRDAAIITAMQHLIHYQIAGYGAICTYAKMEGLYDVAGLIHKNLETEKAVDRKLAILAEEYINKRALDAKLDK